MKGSVRRMAILLALVAAAPRLQAKVTNAVDIAALAACGNGTTNGWTVCGVDSYSGKTNVRLSEQGDCLLSPEFAGDISEILICVKSSSQTGRRLTFFPCSGGTPSADGSRSCDYTPNKDTYRDQLLDFTGAAAFRSFKIGFDNPKDGSTGWGFCSLAVVTDDSPRFESPRSLDIRRVRAASATIGWTPNPLVASNAVAVSLLTDIPESYTTLTNYDFEACVNPGDSDTQDRSAELAELYPEFSGERIYYPAKSSGILRISTGKENGRLTHSGLADYCSLTLAVTAKRYPGDTSCTEISAYWLDAGSQTNRLGTVAIGDDFATGIIPLAAAANGSAIHLGNLDGFKSERRFLIDRIAFLKDYIPASVTTNLVQTSVTTGSEIAVRGLEKGRRYLVQVTALDAAGNSAPPSPTVAFTTAERESGIGILVY